MKVWNWFDRLTDEQPTLERRQASDDGTGQSGDITTSWSDCSGSGCLHPVIRTFDAAGDPADRAFVYVLYHADHHAE